MICLKSVYKTMLWGGLRIRDVLHKDVGDLKRVAESWEVSTHKNGRCMIGSGEYAGKTLSEYYDAVGWENVGGYGEKHKCLPIMIKYIDACKDLSVQVHPGERYARKHEGDGGKNEMWYVLGADEGACIYLGFNRDVTGREIRTAIKNDAVLELLNRIPVHKGEVFYIPAGTVHAIGAGCLICEIQQTSDATYRLYDFGRIDENGKPRQLSVKKALDVLNLRRTPVPTGRSVLSVNKKARTMLGVVEHLTVAEYDAFGEYTLFMPGAKFGVALILEGEGDMEGEEGVTHVTQGESWLLTSRRYTIRGKCRALIVSY